MQIINLEVRNFRNFKAQEFSFSDGVNIIAGNNAQGKTSLLEAINYVAALCSFRSNHEREVINFDSETAFIAAEILSGGVKSRIEISLSRDSKRCVYLNGKKERRSAEVAGRLKTVLFTPDDLYIVKSAAAVRRKFIDDAVGQLRPRYSQLLYEYLKLLDHKRAILRLQTGKNLLESLDVYNIRLCEIGSVLIRHRASFLRRLGAQADEILQSLTSGKEELKLKYLTDKYIDDPESGAREIALGLLQHMKSCSQQELFSGKCLVGPHRDDFDIEICNMSARLYASQGQVRSAALALIIGERNVYLDDTGELPVLLLDDVLSELDEERRRFLLKNAGGGQVFITTCDRNIQISAQNRLIVNNGKLEK